eukprot:TRINITY_DN15043_c0_g1_i8.p3 TRINITY_DN15043_c0_g1~~TRINITY_DN15043_c0_g1_i8.p3  ORF type:complete len:220 (+),score=-12.58 TRINITY_DN15043_c0_g1_i8:76-735(+)
MHAYIYFGFSASSFQNLLQIRIITFFFDQELLKREICKQFRELFVRDIWNQYFPIFTTITKMKFVNNLKYYFQEEIFGTNIFPYLQELQKCTYLQIDINHQVCFSSEPNFTFIHSNQSNSKQQLTNHISPSSNPKNFIFNALFRSQSCSYQPSQKIITEKNKKKKEVPKIFITLCACWLAHNIKHGTKLLFSLQKLYCNVRTIKLLRHLKNTLHALCAC